MSETKRQKFLRLAEARGEKAEYHINLLANLASPNYEYDRSDAEALVGRLETSLAQVRDAFGITVPDVEETLAAGPVAGRDRRDIRNALRDLQSGRVVEGIKELQHIVCGWVVPDQV